MGHRQFEDESALGDGTKLVVGRWWTLAKEEERNGLAADGELHTLRLGPKTTSQSQ